MLTAKVSEYRAHLANLHEKVLKNHDPLRISGNKGDVIVLPAEDYENLIETVYILKDKVTMSSLFETRKDMANNNFNGTTIEESFSDLES